MLQPVTKSYKLLLFKFYTVNLTGVQSAGWLDIHFTVGTSCERAAPLAEKNAAARHHVLRSLISLHNEHNGHPTKEGQGKQLNPPCMIGEKKKNKKKPNIKIIFRVYSLVLSTLGR
jgi:hypothetical protein